MSSTAAPLRIIACCGEMVEVAGLERLTFEVLRMLRREGATVHTIVNTWSNERILALSRSIGATSSTGYYWYSFGKHLLNPLRLVQFLWDVAMTSRGLLADAHAHRPTHILLPTFTAAIRNAPALWWLRRRGVRVILRVGNHPAPGRAHRFIWSRVVPALVDRVIANSVFSRDRLAEGGVPPAQLGLVRNCVSTRGPAPEADTDAVALVAARRTVLVVGQVAPFKGTHLAVDAALRMLGDGDDLQLVIVGRLPDWPAGFVAFAGEMQARVAAAGRGDRIHFIGERQDVPALMRAAYVLAAPILQEETFGNVALEATAAGLPPVVFPTGGLVELVDHRRTGFICRDATVEALVEGLRYFLADAAARASAHDACLALHRQPDFPYRPAAFRAGWLEEFSRRA